MTESERSTMTEKEIKALLEQLTPEQEQVLIDYLSTMLEEEN